MAFTYLKVKSTKCLCLFPVAMVRVRVRVRVRWSCYFGRGLGLKNLLLFISLLFAVKLTTILRKFLTDLYIIVYLISFRKYAVLK